MVRIYDVNQSELIKEVASELKKDEKMKMPYWALFAKTGSSKERPPLNNDWWYLRAASILRRICIFGPIGVSKLRTKYGSKKNRGVKPEMFVRAGGKIIRFIMQELEAAGYVKKDVKSAGKGRLITPKGMSLLDKTSGRIFKAPEPVQKAEPAKQEASKDKEAGEEK